MPAVLRCEKATFYVVEKQRNAISSYLTCRCLAGFQPSDVWPATCG